jgi:hypothetical protein
MVDLTLSTVSMSPSLIVISVLNISFTLLNETIKFSSIINTFEIRKIEEVI